MSHPLNLNFMHNQIPPFYNIIEANMNLPIISNQLALASSRQFDMCGYFEKQYYRCMAAYGMRLGQRYCQLEARDFCECADDTKQKLRMTAIRRERYRQWLDGKRERPFHRKEWAPTDAMLYGDWHDYTRSGW